MRLDELSAGTPRLVRLRSDGRALPDVRPGAEVELSRAGGAETVLIRLAGDVSAVVGVTPADERHLDGVLARNLPRLGHVVARYPKQGTPTDVTVAITEFVVRIAWAQPTAIAVDEKALERVRMVTGDRRLRIEGALDWLASEFLLPPVAGHTDVRAVVALPPADRDASRDFRLLGVRRALDIVLGADGRLTVRRVRDGHGELRDGWRLGLLTGAIAFCDTTVAAQLTGVVRAQLEQLAAGGGEYLSMWTAYHEREVVRLEEQAQALGVIPYRSAQQVAGGGWRFTVTTTDDGPGAALWDAADEEVDLEAVPADASPAVSTVTIDGITENPIAAIVSPRGRSGERTFSGRLNRRALRNGQVEVVPQGGERLDPPPSGVLRLSLQGQRTMLRRRERAIAKIRASETPMRQLGLLLENQPVPSATRTRINPHSRRVEQVVGGALTEQQRRALDVALNTPDIALIQGPPGTGKTRVIAALQQRLAEEANASARLTGKVLLTSFQHEAVENAIASAQVFGLPAIKIGERRRARESAKPMEVWRAQQANRVRASLRDLGFEVAEVHRQVRRIARGYAERPTSRHEGQALLEQLLEIASAHLSADLLARVHARVRALRAEAHRESLRGAEALTTALRCVRAIRVQPATFADDGPLTARRAAQWIADLELPDSDADVSLLRRAARADQIDELTAGALSEARARMIDRLLAPLDAPPLVDGMVEALLNDAERELAEVVRRSPAGLPRALATYLDDLLTDPRLVADTLKKYTSVVAATCQQAGGRLIREFTGESAFETVIVDEAARANPLDLFIPMALAQDRIVLVGDHRQLPHLIEHELERELEARLPDLQAEWRKSLFERLFKGVLRDMERRDGIPRIVTLDTQFRMHPTLGRFVSENFYEIGEPGDRVTLKPGRAAGEFAHALPSYAGRVAGWLDVPLHEGAEQTGVSKSRPAEARRIAAELRRLLDDPASAGLTFGVISFYRRQVMEIEAALLAEGVAERVAGYLRYRPEYRELTRADGLPVERLRVGTVDEFQGREFDVVFLSMTRSNSVGGTEPTDIRRKYGHLVLANRMCVAMSRQKRLLITVGDSAMLAHPAAEGVVPALVRFRALCESEEGTVG